MSWTSDNSGRPRPPRPIAAAGRVPRRRAGCLLAVAFAAVGLCACGGGSTVNTSPSSGHTGAGDTSTAGGASTGTRVSSPGASGSGHGGWVLGGLVDLTGTDAAGGAATEKGMSYVLSRINRAGGIHGHRISIKYCDTQSTPTGAAQCAHQLASVNTHMVLALSSDPPTRGALPVLTHQTVLAIDPVLMPKSGTNVFQVTSSSAVVAAALVDEAKAAHMSTIGVLYTTDTSGTHQLQAAAALAKKAGIKVVSQAQDASSTDVTPQLTKLRSAGAQVIYLASVGTNTSAAVNSYRTLGMSQPVVVGAAAVTNGFLRSLSSVPDHLYGVAHLMAGTSALKPAVAKAFRTYIDGFKAQEGVPADTQSTSAVYAGCVAGEALRNAGTSVAGITSFLRTHSFTCLGSRLRYDLPGLNVVNGQPAGLVAAPRVAADGWGPVEGPL